MTARGLRPRRATPSAPKEKRRRRKRRADYEDLHRDERLNQLSGAIVTYIRGCS